MTELFSKFLYSLKLRRHKSNAIFFIIHHPFWFPKKTISVLHFTLKWRSTKGTWLFKSTFLTLHRRIAVETPGRNTRRRDVGMTQLYNIYISKLSRSGCISMQLVSTSGIRKRTACSEDSSHQEAVVRRWDKTEALRHPDKRWNSKQMIVTQGGEIC